MGYGGAKAGRAQGLASEPTPLAHRLTDHGKAPSSACRSQPAANPPGHADCRRVPRARHRGERCHLLDVRPDAAPAAARGRPGFARQPERARAEAGIGLMQPTRRLRRDVQLPDVPGPRAAADRVHGNRRARAIFGESRVSGTDAERPGAARLGKLLPGARLAAGARPALQPRGRRCAGRAACRRAQLRVLADALRRPVRRPQPAARRQRAADDDRGRRAARIWEHDTRPAARGVRAHDDARRHGVVFLRRAREPPCLLGLPVRPVEARRDAGRRARRSERPVPRPS